MANIITLIRFPLLFLYLGLIFSRNPAIIFWCVPFIILITLMDTFDGLIARARGEESLLGSALDIAVDRAFEIILWITFAHLRLIPLVIPIIAVTRGTLTDAIRAVGVSTGEAAFDQIKHPVNRFLVSSRLMRDFYGIVKGSAFALLTAAWGLINLGHNWENVALLIARTFSWMAITLTVVRGFPVFVESQRLFKDPPKARKKPFQNEHS